jgi:type II secretion system protein N
MRLKKSPQILGIILLLGTVFIVSFWLNLSSEKLSAWLEYQLNQYTDKQFQISILKADTRIWGMFVEELVVIQKKSRERVLSLQEIEVKVDPYTLLSRWGMGVDSKLYHGEIESAWRFYPGVEIDYSLYGIKINQNPYLRKMGIIGLDPKISGTGNTLLTKNMVMEMAEVDLEFDHLILKSNSKQLSLPLKLPDTELKKSSFKLDYDNKLLNLDIHLTGDIKGKIKGNVKGNLENYKKLKLNIKVRADLDRKYRDKLGFVRAILDTYSEKPGKLSVHLGGSVSSPIFKKL